MVELGMRSGKYIGNGTTQNIEFSTNWRNLQIISADRKYVMLFFKDNSGLTTGQAAIGSGGTYKQLTITEGGITEIMGGFSVGDHISINENGIEYFWSVS